MNSGTKIRVAMAIAICFNAALMATDVAQFNNSTVDLIYRILSTVATFVVVFCNTWYNNDFTEEAARGTGITRQLKKEKEEGYIGEVFFNDEEEETDAQ